MRRRAPLLLGDWAAGYIAVAWLAHYLEAYWVGLLIFLGCWALNSLGRFIDDG